MTLEVALLGLGVFGCAAAGAGIRFLVSERLNRQLPYGTLLINVAASLALGALSQAGESMQVIVGVGGLGALSTWSTVANEVAQLARAEEGWAAILYLVATVTTGVLAAWLGIQLVTGA
ncbi:MAG: CrcB family protein [Acidimicrobiia bacterium]|nr:CrcB family protein [Acidimicrobiia bacterium]